MANINRSIKFLRIVVIITLALLLITHFWYWVLPYSYQYISLDHQILNEYGGIQALDSKQKILGFIITSIPMSAMVWSLILLLKLTSVLSAGRWFDKLCEDYCVRVGRWLLVFVVLNVLHRTALVIAITLDYPEGERHITLSFSANDLMALVPAIMALIIGHMVRLAREQQDELNEIV